LPIFEVTNQINFQPVDRIGTPENQSTFGWARMVGRVDDNFERHAEIPVAVALNSRPI
jgi:hypothetical protein